MTLTEPEQATAEPRALTARQFTLARAAIALVVVVLAVAALTTDAFLTQTNLTNLLKQMVASYSGWHWLHRDQGRAPESPAIEQDERAHRAQPAQIENAAANVTAAEALRSGRLCCTESGQFIQRVADVGDGALFESIGADDADGRGRGEAILAGDARAGDRHFFDRCGCFLRHGLCGGQDRRHGG